MGEFVTTITLDHTLYTGLAAGALQNPPQQSYQPNNNLNVNQQQYQPVKQPPPQGNFNQIQYVQQPATTPRPFIQNTQRPFVQNTQRPPVRPPVQLPSGFDNIDSGSGEKFNDINTQCGVPNNRIKQSTGLVVNGKAAAKGQVRIEQYSSLIDF